MASLHARSLFCLALLVSSAAALKFTGSVDTTDDTVYVGKFAFGTGANGKVTVSATAPPGVNNSFTRFVIFDDQPKSWPTALKADNCEDRFSARRVISGVEPPFIPLNDLSFDVNENYVRWWYFTFMNCAGERLDIPEWNVEVTWDGSQLPYQMIGLGPTYCFFFVTLLVASFIFIHPVGRAYFKHDMSRMLPFAMLLEVFSRMFLMAYYYTAQNSGNLVGGVLGFGLWSDQITQMLLLSVVLAVSHGWHFKNMGKPTQIVLVSSVTLFLILGFVTIVYGSMIMYSYDYNETIMATPVGTAFTTFRLLLLIINVVVMFRVTIPMQSGSPDRHTWFKQFFIASAAWQFLYVFFSYCVHAAPTYNQAKVCWALLCSIDTLFFGALFFLLNPKRIEPLFTGFMEEPISNSGLSSSFVDDAPKI